MKPLRIAIVTGEASGDQLGASLLAALRGRGIDLEFMGIGGPAMAAEGFRSLFDQNDIAVMGLGPVIRRLPLILRRIRESAAAIIAAKPDILVTIDAPDFSKRVARRVRAAAPEIPIMHWVCPSVWAWRPGRAPAMKPYIDHILCLLPFEPAALGRLKGPPGSYIGHPLVERIPEMRPKDAEETAARADLAAPVLLMLPGSRMSEIRRLLPLFMGVARRIAASHPGARWILPTLPHLALTIRAMVRASGVDIDVVTTPQAKLNAMRSARAAIAASGTVTLELALADIPMVTAYRVAAWEAAIARRLVTVSSAILPNLVLGENVVPEFIQEAATLDNLHAAFAPLLDDGTAFGRQRQGFARLETIMRATGLPPSEAAARHVLDLARNPRDR